MSEETLQAYLVFYLISISKWFVGIFVWVQSSNKLVVVNVAVTITIKNVCYSTHLQSTGGELYKDQGKELLNWSVSQELKE